MNTPLVGIVGVLGAGKTTLSTALQEAGFQSISLSGIYRDWSAGRGIKKYDRGVYMSLVREMRRKEGPDGLMERTLEKMKAGGERFVIDGMRVSSEIEFLREHVPGCQMIGIQTEIDVLVDRILGLDDRPSDPTSEEEVRRIIDLELAGKLYNVGYCLDTKCNQVINNNGTLAAFQKEVRRVVAELTA